MALLSK